MVAMPIRFGIQPCGHRRETAAVQRALEVRVCFFVEVVPERMPGGDQRDVHDPYGLGGESVSHSRPSEFQGLSPGDGAGTETVEQIDDAEQNADAEDERADGHQHLSPSKPRPC